EDHRGPVRRRGDAGCQGLVLVPRHDREPPAGGGAEVSEPEVLITLKGARLGYHGRTIIDRVDLEVDRGDFLAIIGPNGSGKTTILRAMLGILEPTEGTVERRVRAAYAPQRRALDAIYPFTTREMVAMGLLGMAGASLGKKDAAERVERALDSCGILRI